MSAGILFQVHLFIPSALIINAQLLSLLFTVHTCVMSPQLLSPDFTVYLDSEIETAERDSPSESLLVTIKLRLLDEQGKK